MRALDQAEHDLAEDDEYRWWYMSPEHAHEMGAYRATALASLRRHQEAVDAFDWTLDRMDPGVVEWRLTLAQDRERALAAL